MSTEYDLEKVPELCRDGVDFPQFADYYQDLITNGNEKVFFYKHYKCLIRRNMFLGNLCGYVYICPDRDITEIGSVYEINYRDEEKIGFDCGHGYIDFVPGMGSLTHLIFPNTTYKDFNFVEAELKKIVNQLIKQ